MADYAPLEKLQPCLLDRLTDDDPKSTEESRSQRVISVQRYRRGVLRDLAWLFNASAHLPDEGKDRWRLEDFPDANRSVINFGTRQLSGLFAPNKSVTFARSTPGAYQAWLEETIRYTHEQNVGDERLVFINAWNEWAEGAHLEPDRRFGRGFLEATRNALQSHRLGRLR
jgi:hypothetical protein